MSNDTTRSLSRILEKTKDCRDADKFIEDNACEEMKSFSNYLNEQIGNRDLKTAEVIRRSGVDRNYAYNILNGRRNPNRDRIIALCIASEMTFSQIQRGLEIAKFRPLYPKDPRDVRISVAINNAIYEVNKINSLLERYELEILDI